MQEEKNNKPTLSIEVPETVLEGVYSNLAVIAHSSSEFVIDFVRIVPNAAKAKVKSRIIMNPEHAKRLMHALSENVAAYERQFGEIKMPEQKIQLPLHFDGLKGEA
ncbi:MAG: DUF3467 domain-containing protein [Paludibacteraceae bacterium]|nr:DUF3467 domain-containing protein [Paludibacteraceae bacterium]